MADSALEKLARLMEGAVSAASDKPVNKAGGGYTPYEQYRRILAVEDGACPFKAGMWVHPKEGSLYTGRDCPHLVIWAGDTQYVMPKESGLPLVKYDLIVRTCFGNKVLEYIGLSKYYEEYRPAANWDLAEEADAVSLDRFANTTYVPKAGCPAAFDDDMAEDDDVSSSSADDDEDDHNLPCYEE